MNKIKHTRHIIRRIVFVILTAAAFIIQCTVIPAAGISFPVFILIPLLVSVAMFEKEFSGFFFGLFTGALWDLASTLPDGLLAFLMSAFACVVGLLSKYIIRNTLLNALIISLTGCIIYCALSLFFIPGSLPFETYTDLIKTLYLPGSAAALLLLVPIYFTVRAIALKLREENI